MAAMLRLRTLCVLVLGVCAFAGEGQTFAASNWVPTATRAFPFNGSVALNPVPPDRPLHIVVSLRLQNPGTLKTFLKNQHASGETLTPAEFVSSYSPTSAQVQSVTTYLTSQGFRNLNVSPDRILIQADGTAQTAEQAFHTRLVEFPVDGKTVFAPSQDVEVPGALAKLVLSVAGLENLSGASRLNAMASKKQLNIVPADDIAQRLQPPALAPAAGTLDPTISVFTPDAIRTAYDADTTSTGAGAIAATITEGDDLSQVISDLRQAETLFGLPLVPVTVRQVVPVPDPQDNSGDTEWDLDSQWITGIAYNVQRLIFYNTASLNDADLLVANDVFAQDNLAKVGNMSYGGCENLEALLGGLQAFDQLFEKAVAQGQTWSASAGDSGAACAIVINLATPDLGVPSSVEFPASSPYVVAVGGTTLFTDSNYDYNTELAWDAGGGGISLFENAPPWQVDDGAVPTGIAGLRAVPDVAMVAGPEGAAGAGIGGAADVVINGAQAGVLGTSWSSPLNVGVWARLESARCNALGFEAPLIYALDTSQTVGSGAAGFHDIIVGTNGEYVATPGWDYTTGYGSFDVGAVNAALPAASGGCTPPDQATPPVAELNVSPAIDVAPLTASFDGNGSSDSGSGQLTSYALQYGDGAVTVQDSSALPAHTYQVPGRYTASLRVRNAFGAISSTVQQTIAVLGTPSACLPGGDVVLTSPVGVSFGVEGEDAGSGADDLLSTSVSEPANKPGKLVFSMKVANLDTIPPGFRWVTYFDIAGRNDPMNDYYYVAMVSADGGNPVFNYGTHGLTPGGASDYTVLGSLDSASNEQPDGTVTLVLDESTLGIQTGDQLTNILSATRTSAPDGDGGLLNLQTGVPGGAGLTQDEAGAVLPYTVAGNATCASDAAPVPHLTANTVSGAAPLTVDFDGSGSTPQPGQAQVAYYRFSFGDGTSTPWQTAPTAEHAYQSPDSYVATLEVADSRGLVSTSESSVTIVAQVPPSGG